MLLLSRANWHALAKLETELKRLAETSSPQYSPQAYGAPRRAYGHAAVLDRCRLSRSDRYRVGALGFFSSRGTRHKRRSQRAATRGAHGRADVFGADDRECAEPHFTFAHLREEFMEFCDSLNLDAISNR